MSMAEGETDRAVTANRLRDGVPVYFAGHAAWSVALADAVLVAAADGEALLATAQAGPLPLPVVAPYLIEAVRDAGAVRPLSLRERIRAFGPTA
jgi:hypothetical protein